MSQKLVQARSLDASAESSQWLQIARSVEVPCFLAFLTESGAAGGATLKSADQNERGGASELEGGASE